MNPSQICEEKKVCHGAFCKDGQYAGFLGQLVDAIKAALRPREGDVQRTVLYRKVQRFAAETSYHIVC